MSLNLKPVVSSAKSSNVPVIEALLNAGHQPTIGIFSSGQERGTVFLPGWSGKGTVCSPDGGVRHATFHPNPKVREGTVPGEHKRQGLAEFPACHRLVCAREEGAGKPGRCPQASCHEQDGWLHAAAPASRVDDRR
ncbi:hypothetical protein, partial [Arthrobacter cavernae]